MRKLLTLLILLTGVAQAATTVPVQLMNPAGSTAGQAIVSTGPSSAPGWATVTAGGITPIAANSVYANFTGSSASPIAKLVPSCSTANSALQYTSGTGLSCGATFALTSGNLSQFASTTSLQLLGVLSDETGTGAAVFGTSPALATPTISGAALSGTFSGAPTFSGAVTFTSTITPSQTAGIVGTTTNNNANAGSFGEYQAAGPTTTGNLTSATTANITSVSLTAGDWDVDGLCAFNPAGGASITVQQCGITTTSATFGSFGTVTSLFLTSTAGSGFPAPTTRISIASTTTVFLATQVTFTGGTVTATGVIRARRVR